METTELNEGAKALQIVNAEDGRKVPQRVLDCLAALLSDIYHGKEWPAVWFEQRLGHVRETIGFGKALSHVNLLLEAEGYHLTSRGRNGAFYRVETVDRSANVAKSFNKQAINLLKRGAVFAHATLQKHGHLLDEAQKRKLQKAAEISAVRYVLASRLK